MRSSLHMFRSSRTRSGVCRLPMTGIRNSRAGSRTRMRSSRIRTRRTRMCSHSSRIHRRTRMCSRRIHRRTHMCSCSRRIHRRIRIRIRRRVRRRIRVCRRTTEAAGRLQGLALRGTGRSIRERTTIMTMARITATDGKIKEYTSKSVCSFLEYTVGWRLLFMGRTMKKEDKPCRTHHRNLI